MIAILQNIYLLVNIIGVAVGLVWFVTAADCPFVSTFFTAVRKYLGKPGVFITSTLVVLLLIPSITIMSIILTFTMLLGNYAAQLVSFDWSL